MNADAVIDRATTQRDRILCAARRCFIDHGFHAASMASIAEVADMSAGLIYRYFDSKNAIILAIIERQLADKRADIAALQPGTDFAQGVRDLVARWRSGDVRTMNPTLLLEMSALASRDPQIAAALCEADRVTRSDFATWLVQRAASSGVKIDADAAQTRAFALQCLIEGLAVRIVREPGMSDHMLADMLAMNLPVVID